jgi:hypothetical protein
MTAPLIVRLERKYTPEPNSGCWLWFGSVNDDGYGRVRGEDKKTKSAHRESYRLYRGEFDPKLQVLHHCDNPSCVNPDHLFLGTVTDNMQDMKRKGRGKSPQRGTKHHFAKLNTEKAFEIRWLSSLGVKRRDLAKNYGVAKNSIDGVVSRLTWRPEIHE